MPRNQSDSEGIDENVDYSLIKKPVEQTNEGTLQYKLEMYQRVIREWRGSLSSDEFSVVMLIMDRTVGWGQPSATITAGSMMHGGGMYSGMDISRATYFRVLGTLEEKGLIRRRKTGTGSNRISINPGWTPAMLKRPKRLKNASEDPSQAETTPSHSEATPSQRETLYTGNPITDNPLTRSVAASGPNSNQKRNSAPEKSQTQPSPQDPPSKPEPEAAQQKIETAVSGNRAARQAKINRTKGRTDVSAGIETTWRAALNETFPGVSHAPWDGRIRKNVKDKAKAWTFANQVAFDELVDWSVRNWTQIVKRQFKWMRKRPAPSHPDIGFFIRFSSDFMEVWAGGELKEWLRKPERTKHELLMAKGRTREEAGLEIATDRAAGQMNKKNKAAIRKAKQIRGEARLARAQAQDMLDKVNVPPRRREPLKLKVTKEVDPANVIVPILPEGDPYDD
ncbi:MAG: hypothetical protein ABJP34_03630 [Erythrobacter sp.]